MDQLASSKHRGDQSLVSAWLELLGRRPKRLGQPAVEDCTGSGSRVMFLQEMWMRCFVVYHIAPLTVARSLIIGRSMRNSLYHLQSLLEEGATEVAMVDAASAQGGPRPVCHP